ncbi:hypothetical protein BJV77DRAFT_514289 [Russula vinacea]|nr:hypothetical protein BJV77DRAFT_514289 [Russula vinacea]
MELFDYQPFDVIIKLLKNRDVVVWCTKLAHSDANERVDVEAVMRELGWILRELAGDRQAMAQAEDAMDVDEQAKSARVHKTVTLAQTWRVRFLARVDAWCPTRRPSYRRDHLSARRRGKRKFMYQPPNRSPSRRVELYQSPTRQNGHDRVSLVLNPLIACRASSIQ